MSIRRSPRASDADSFVILTTSRAPVGVASPASASIGPQGVGCPILLRMQAELGVGIDGVWGAKTEGMKGATELGGWKKRRGMKRWTRRRWMLSLTPWRADRRPLKEMGVCARAARCALDQMPESKSHDAKRS